MDKLYWNLYMAVLTGHIDPFVSLSRFKVTQGRIQEFKKGGSFKKSARENFWVTTPILIKTRLRDRELN